MGHNGIGDGFVNVIRAPRDDRMLATFLVLQRMAARFFSTVNIILLLWSKERNNIVRKQQLMYNQTHSTYIKIGSMKRKRLGVSYVHNSTASTKVIPSREATIHREKD